MKQSTQQDIQHAFTVKHVQPAIFTPPLWRIECRKTIILKCNALVKGTAQISLSMAWDTDSEPGLVCKLCLCGYWIRNLSYITFFYLAEAIEVHSASRNVAYIKSIPLQSIPLFTSCSSLESTMSETGTDKGLNLCDYVSFSKNVKVILMSIYNCCDKL